MSVRDRRVGVSLEGGPWHPVQNQPVESEEYSHPEPLLASSHSASAATVNPQNFASCNEISIFLHPRQSPKIAVEIGESLRAGTEALQEGEVVRLGWCTSAVSR